MHQAIVKRLETLGTKCLSSWVKPVVLPDDPVLLLNPTLPVLYVLEVGGLADRAALSLICQQFGLPDPSAKLRYANLIEPSSVDVLKRRRGSIFRRHRLVHSVRLQRLIVAGLETETAELQIVPIAIYWGRAPDKEASFWSQMFSERWQIAGRTRKLFTSLIHGRETLVRISEPLSLRTLIDSENTPDRLQHKLSRILRVHFRQRRIASLGPDQSHRRMLINHVVADPGVRQQMLAESADDPRKHTRLKDQAERYAVEIAADVSYPAIRTMNRVLTRLWNQLYDGIEVSGLERLQSVADGHELVYVPCHRSHIDYLLLSYILYGHGFSLPHIAAGINLKLPVVGGLLRRGGAFFLRRTFAGNKLYAAVFNAYLKEILQRGHALEYFIEGGRSRSGRLLPPKSGMLAMTVHAYLRDPRTPVVFVPVYFGYERLLEGRAFISELTGGTKQKETFFALIKSWRILRKNYGRVYVNFAEPIALDDLLAQHRQQWRGEEIGGGRPAWMTPVIAQLGESIMQQINQAASVTPISLLATALLSTPKGRLSYDELIQQIQIYRHLFTAIQTGTAVVVPDINPINVIEHGHKLGFVETVKDPLGKLVVLTSGQAAQMTYFRNNIQHLLTLPSLVACCFTNSVTRSDAELQQLVAYAYPFLQAELFLISDTSSQLMTKTLQTMSDSGLIKSVDSKWRRPVAGSTESVSLIRLAEAVVPALERYFLTSAILAKAGVDGISTEVLAERSKACAERLALTHGYEAAELYDKYLFNTFIQTLHEQGYVQSSEGRVVICSSLINLEADSRTLLGEQIRHAILNATLTYETSYSRV